MARIERDREDLLAEATALVERVELELPGRAEHVIVGFRSTGCGSVYFDPDEAYQFNTAGELRRAYRDGAMYKAEGGRLVRLTRERTSDQVQLIRHSLDAAETAELLRQMTHQLTALRSALAETTYSVVGQKPSEVDFATKVTGWLDSLPHGAIARTPHAR